MKHATRLASSFFALLFAVQIPGFAQQQSRTEHLIYTIPPGWKRVEKEQYTALVPPNLPAGKMVEIRITPMRPLAGASVEGNVREEMAFINKNYTAVQPSAPATVRHPNGFEMGCGGASMQAAPGANQFLYAVFYFARANDQVQPIYFVTDDQPLYMSHRAAVDAFVRSLKLSDLIVLAQGNPALTQSKVDQTTDFLEWLMETPFTEEQRRTITSFMIDAWQKNDRTEIDGVDQILKLRTQLSAMTKEQRELARQAAQPEAIKQWRTETDAVAKLMVQIYDAAHQPIAAGDPPLTRQSSDALLEVLFFMACQVNGQPGDVQVTGEMKDEWAKRIAGAYANFNAEAKQGVAQMPMTWAALRVAWPETSDQEKAALRKQWSQSPEVQQIAAAISKLQPKSAAGDSTAADAVALSQKLSKDYETTRTLMNISNTMFQAKMYSAMNFGSTRYEYRYR